MWGGNVRGGCVEVDEWREQGGLCAGMCIKGCQDDIKYELSTAVDPKLTC